MKMAFYPVCMEFDRPRQRNLFNSGLSPNDFTLIVVPKSQQHNENSSIREEKDKFQVNVDVQHFAPDEITVKSADGFIIVEAKHEEREDQHGLISRSFKRRYALPEGVEGELISKLSSDGVLTITAPLKNTKKTNERIVPIIQTGPVRKQSEQ